MAQMNDRYGRQLLTEPGLQASFVFPCFHLVDSVNLRDDLICGQFVQAAKMPQRAFALLAGAAGQAFNAGDPHGFTHGRRVLRA